VSVPAIRIERLSKRYALGRRLAGYVTMREVIMDTLTAPFRRRHRDGGPPRELWALRNVTFDVARGEVVGVVGRNGAGKSTLLKILSRITEPTSGQAAIAGRVASLLEVGTGFHPELTGRENVYLNGVILGMTRAEIRRKFDDIVAFAELETFIDTPVKRYSSGMYLRLAFAVAAHVDPDILILDEVLAVGDHAFQQRCIRQMESVARSGRTVLIVSHNLASLSEIATTGIWLDRGEVRRTGPLNAVVDAYVASGGSATGEWAIGEPPADLPAYVSGLRVLQDGARVGLVKIDQPFDLELRYTLRRPMSFCRVGVLVLGGFGSVIFSTAEPDDPSVSPFDRPVGEYTARCRVPGWLLAAGTYHLTPHIDDAPARRLFTADEACSFTVIDNVARGVSHAEQGRPGLIAPKLAWTLART